MIDILYPVHNRREFTAESARWIANSTPHQLVRKVYVYDDDSSDGAGEVAAKTLGDWFEVEVERGQFGGPVAIMNHYLSRPEETAPLFAKLDNDTVVPPRWLEACLAVMEASPELSLLGIEAMTPVDTNVRAIRNYTPAPFIGGIGLMRRSAFLQPMEPNRFFGFTSWQDKRPGLIKGWLNPSLPVCLLDHLPMDPWRGLSVQYQANGWQREWPLYTAEQKPLWSWFLNESTT
jgi:cellulose synthase/poly-beta-1,6-N-acetylglucosamine synthase-like glycosyltransferase